MSVTHQWMFKVAKILVADGYSVTFSYSPAGTQALGNLWVSNGDSIHLTASGAPFDAHWHASSTANVADNAPHGSTKPNIDPEDDNTKWDGLAKDSTHAVIFTVTGSSKSYARLQLKIPACPDPSGTKSGLVRVLKVPDPSKIIRLTVNVS